MGSPPRDWPICNECGRKLMLISLGDARSYYGCVCVGKWPYNVAPIDDPGDNFEEID